MPVARAGLCLSWSRVRAGRPVTSATRSRVRAARPDFPRHCPKCQPATRNVSDRTRNVSNRTGNAGGRPTRSARRFGPAIQEHVCRWVARGCRRRSPRLPLTVPGCQRRSAIAGNVRAPSATCARLSATRTESSATRPRLSARRPALWAARPGCRRGTQGCRQGGPAVNDAGAIVTGVHAFVRVAFTSAYVGILYQRLAPTPRRPPLPAATRSFSTARGILFAARDDSSRARVSPLTPVPLSCFRCLAGVRRWGAGDCRYVAGQCR